jgi:hypothetical protein
MADLKISDLSALSGGDLVAADELAIVDDSASETKKITVSNLIANGVTLISDDAIPGAKILFGAGDIATAALADSAVTAAKIGADQVTAAKIADNTIVNLVSTLPTSGDYTGQLALDTDDNSLYVYSGSAWLNTKAPGSVNAFTDTTSGIINISTAVSSGTATVTASIDNTASAAQFLAGPVGSAGTVGYRTIDGGDLPTATTTSKGGVIVNGGGLTLSTDTIQIDNSVTASSTKHLVTYDANGLITGGSVIASSDLPVATSSAKGAVIASDGLAVDASGNLSIDNTVTAGTYTKVTVTSKGVVSSGDTLAAADIPDHSAAKLTSGTIGSSLIANDSVTADKLANESTVKFGGALGSDNVTIFPAGDFKGQLFWDETSLDLYVYTGSAFIPITVLSGNLVNAGTYNANTNLVSSITTAGSSAGFAVGSALPAPVGANLNHYVVVDTSGTGTGAAPSVALAPPDMLLSQGVGTEYSLIDVSNAIAGQTASNISFIASGTIAATDVQAALQEVDTEKLPKAGGTMTGDLNLGTSTNVVFEGSSADDYETTLTVTNPTADRTITFPNVTGTVVTSGDTGSVTSTMIVDGAIVNADINASAEIAVSKLANGTARQLLQTDSGGTGVEFTSNVDVPGTLDVTSGATFDSTVAVTGLLSANGKLAYPAGSAAAVSLYSGSDTDTGIYSPGSNQFGISTAGTSRIVVDASGNVGIGTTSPNSYTNYNTLTINDSTGSEVDFEVGGTLTGQLYAQSNLLSIDARGASTDLRFRTNIAERMRIDSSGNVAIGPNTQGHGLLTLSQSASSFLNALVIQQGNTGSTSSDGLHIGISTGVDAYMMHKENRAIFFGTADQERMRIDSSGNVGIGTTPQRHLHIHESATATVGMMLTNGGTGAANDSQGFQLKVGSDTHAEVAQMENSELRFLTNAEERMRISDSGSLNIGITSGATNADITLRKTAPQISLYATPGNESRITLGDTDDYNIGQLGYDNNDDSMFFVTNNSTRIHVDSNGRARFTSGGLSLPSAGEFQTPVFVALEGMTDPIAAAGAALNAVIRTMDMGSNSNAYTGLDIRNRHSGDLRILNEDHATSNRASFLVFQDTDTGNLENTLKITQDASTYLTGVFDHTTSGGANVNVVSGGFVRRSTSSIKYKTQVETLEDSYADALLNCRPVWYRSTCAGDNASHSHWGLIAEEVAEIDPRLVHWSTTNINYVDEVDENGDTVYEEDGKTPRKVRVKTEDEKAHPEGVAYERFVPHLLNLIKRQQTAIETLEAKVAVLEAG